MGVVWRSGRDPAKYNNKNDQIPVRWYAGCKKVGRAIGRQVNDKIYFQKDLKNDHSMVGVMVVVQVVIGVGYHPYIAGGGW